MEHLPTIQEELTRKALDQLERLVNSRSNKLITEAEYALGIDVLWETVSGLVGKDFFEMISMTSVSRNDPSFRRTKMFTHPGGYFIFSLHPDAKIMAMSSDKPDWRKVSEHEFLAEAAKQFESMCLRMEEKGYTSVTLTL